MTTKSIRVVKKFTLNMPGAEPRTFEPGRHNVTAAEADHWFTKAHCDEAAPDDGKDDRDELLAEVQALAFELQARAEAAEAKVVELQALVDAYAMQDDAKKPVKK